MQIAALTDLYAKYTNGQVRMSWGYPKGAPEAVHIYCIKYNGNEPQIDIRTHISNALNNCLEGMNFDYKGINNIDVRSVTYCVFLANRNYNNPNIRELQALGGCFVKVTIGRADVFYDVKSKPSGEGFISHRISISSSASFDAGILGYSYEFNGTDIAVEFPGGVIDGTTKYPAIYLPESSPSPVVCVVDGSNADISVSYKKISGFRWPFCKAIKDKRRNR